MLQLDFSEKVVLITGGTRGIGLETGLVFGRYGARCILTYRWGDHDEDEIGAAFEKAEAPAPLILQADVANGDDTTDLMARLKSDVNQIDVFISNVSVAPIIKSFEDYTLKGLKQGISYSSWPMVGYTLKIHDVFGKYPKYIIGVSSTGPSHYSFGYDFIAASKSVLEVLSRYLSYRLKDEEVVINTVRSRAVRTQSLQDTFGEDFEGFISKLVPENYWVEPAEVANAILALCSGYCDAINGQTITVDRGTSFFDNFMDLYTRYKKGVLNLGGDTPDGR